MDEVKRFMRHVMPGGVTVAQIIIYLYLLDFDWDKRFYLGLMAKNGLGAAGVGLIGLAIIGYVLSNVYFWWINNNLLGRYWGWYHEPVFGYIDKKKNIDMEILWHERLNEEGLNKLSGSDRVAIFNLFWWFSVGKSKRMEKIDAYISPFCDMIHGLGASLAGSFVSLVAIFVLHFGWPGRLFLGDCFKNCIALILWIAFVFIFYVSYRRLKRYSENVMNSSFISYLAVGGGPLKIDKLVYFRR